MDLNAREKESRREERAAYNASVFCFHCDLAGHIKAKCPLKDQPKCFECKVVGHKGADCSVRKARLDAEKVCFRCDGAGHVAACCPQKVGFSKLALYRDDDTQSVSTVATAGEVYCRTCGAQGHVASKCPEAAFMRRIKAKQAKAVNNSPA